jgi:hypothetical protein
MTDIPTVPCKTCGEPTTFTGTRQCNFCHEVEIRLDGYLRRGGAKARLFVLRALAPLSSVDMYASTTPAFNMEGVESGRTSSSTPRAWPMERDPEPTPFKPREADSLSHSLAERPPLTCKYCARAITDESYVGAGSGDGQEYAHKTCWEGVNGPLRPMMPLDEFMKLTPDERAKHMRERAGEPNTRVEVSRTGVTGPTGTSEDRGGSRLFGGSGGLPLCEQCRIKPVAYDGAWFCGAACSMAHEAHMPKGPRR